jgi:hypothetical protein
MTSRCLKGDLPMDKVFIMLIQVYIFILGCRITGHAVKFIPADDPGIQYFGRWDRTDSQHPAHSWPGVYIVLKFRGSSIGVRMNDPVNYYNVFIDERFYGVVHGDQKEEADYILADSLENTEHSLRLSKRNTSFDQVFTVAGFLLDGQGKMLPPSPEPGRKIEFLGDSFTAAEGNEATETEMPWEAKMPFTNIDKGFAVLIARHFNAQYTLTCRPGIGMANDWQGNPEMVLPARFDRTLMDFEEPKWDFSQWIPDLAVICLGLNDYSGFGGWNHEVSEENSALFRTRYHEFTESIRKAYPGVKIVAVATHVEWIRTHVKQVVMEEQAADHDIIYAQFDYFEGGYIANGHPTTATHRKIADQIIEAIESSGFFQ